MAALPPPATAATVLVMGLVAACAGPGGARVSSGRDRSGPATAAGVPITIIVT